MAMLPERSSSVIDPLSRILVFISGIFSIIALTLSIVGTATYFWYYTQDINGNTVSYNFFTQCSGNLLNNSVNFNVSNIYNFSKRDYDPTDGAGSVCYAGRTAPIVGV